MDNTKYKYEKLWLLGIIIIIFALGGLSFHIYLISYYMNLLVRKHLPYYLAIGIICICLWSLIMGLISIWVAISPYKTYLFWKKLLFITLLIISMIEIPLLCQTWYKSKTYPDGQRRYGVMVTYLFVEYLLQFGTLFPAFFMYERKLDQMKTL